MGPFTSIHWILDKIRIGLLPELGRTFLLLLLYLQKNHFYQNSPENTQVLTENFSL